MFIHFTTWPNIIYSELCEQLSFDMELMTNDEEVQQALRKYKKDLDDQKKRVEDVFGQLSYEKNIILQSQATINKCTAAEAEYEDKLYDTLLVYCRLLITFIFRFSSFPLISLFSLHRTN